MVQIIVKISGDATECKEWAIVELQGDLETRHSVPLSGQFIGDLHFTHKDVPILIIGHHILHGKVITLEKPLAVISKSSDTSDGNSSQPDIGSAVSSMETDGENTPASGCSRTCYYVQAIITKKLLFKTRPKPIIAYVPKKL